MEEDFIQLPDDQNNFINNVLYHLDKNRVEEIFLLDKRDKFANKFQEELERRQPYKQIKEQKKDPKKQLIITANKSVETGLPREIFKFQGVTFVMDCYQQKALGGDSNIEKVSNIIKSVIDDDFFSDYEEANEIWRNAYEHNEFINECCLESKQTVNNAKKGYKKALLQGLSTQEFDDLLHTREMKKVKIEFENQLEDYEVSLINPDYNPKCSNQEDYEVSLIGSDNKSKYFKLSGKKSFKEVRSNFLTPIKEFNINTNGEKINFHEEYFKSLESKNEDSFFLENYNKTHEQALENPSISKINQMFNLKNEIKQSAKENISDFRTKVMENNLKKNTSNQGRI